MAERKRDYIAEGEASYQRWRDSLLADPKSRRLYEEEAARSALWLQLVEARHAAWVRDLLYAGKSVKPAPEAFSTPHSMSAILAAVKKTGFIKA